MSVLYTDNDLKCCQWLENLVAAGQLPAGRIICRDIRDFKPADFDGFKQVHHFCGIGGWPYALKLAGWPEDEEVWTLSCPCQPFSCAGKGMGESDERHLWPFARNLIGHRKPASILGEQVASAAGRTWLGKVRTDLELLAYRFCASGLCAYSVRAPHERLRSCWFADSAVNGSKRIQRGTQAQVSQDRPSEALDPWHGVGSPFENWEKLMAEPFVRRMDDGVSSCLDIRPRLHAYGNAIVPQVAAQFIQAAREAIAEL